MLISALFIKETKEILFSRSVHDFRESECGNYYVDGGLDYFRFGGDPDGYVFIKLDGDELLKMILFYDFKFKNFNAADFPDGYHGKFKITEKSNFDFFRRLITNFEDIEEYL